MGSGPLLKGHRFGVSLPAARCGEVTYARILIHSKITIKHRGGGRLTVGALNSGNQRTAATLPGFQFRGILPSPLEAGGTRTDHQLSKEET
jgi:hypothetical protein